MANWAYQIELALRPYLYIVSDI